jgi:hypothetical protein
MRKATLQIAVIVSALIALGAGGQGSTPSTKVLKLDSTSGLEILNSRAEIVNYRGKRTLHLAPQKEHDPNRESMVALVTGTDFKDGTIEAEVAGLPITEMDATARGFVGVLFRTQDHGSRAENMYIRPTNGRADDQLRRNHSVQYESLPDFPWHRLRKESPGVYESYADLEAGAWTKIRIEVAGTKARLYVNGASQPCLIINDLKLGESRGQVGLWAYFATDAYFSELKITRTN